MESSFRSRHACPACESTRYAVKISKPFTDPQLSGFIQKYYGGNIPLKLLEKETFEIAECPCGFVWQTNVLNEAGMGLFYGDWIDPDASLNKRKFANVDYYLNLAKNLARFKAGLMSASSLKSFDFGMGWGHWAIMALAFGFDSYGSEISRDRIDYARRRGVKIIDEVASIEPGTFHLINADQVMEHIPDPQKSLNDLSRILATGGILHVAVPNGSKEIASINKGVWKPAKGATQPLEHINTYTPKSLVQMANRAGLKLKKNWPDRMLLTDRQYHIDLNFLPLDLYLGFAGTGLCFTK